MKKVIILIALAFLPAQSFIPINVNLKQEFDASQIEGSINRLLESAPEKLKTLYNQTVNVSNTTHFGVLMALAVVLPVTGYLSTKTAWNLIDQRLFNTKPQILLPGSKVGYADRLNRWWSGYKTPIMVFDSSVKERLLEIEEKTKNIRDNIRNGRKITYDNLLLYGPPGTGKTLFAHILADKTNMDFLAVTAASLLQGGIQGVKYFDELIAMANRSFRGTIIFVDEADALFIDRNVLSPESDHYKILNHILAITGTGSDKFMLIAATNHTYTMDEAMGRRFQDRVLMPLPNIATRKQLIELYAQQTLFNEKENGKEFVKKAKALLSADTIEHIAEQTAGLSHAEIKDMVVAMGKKASATKTGMITQVHIESAVEQAVEKVKALQADQEKRQQRQEA